MGIGTVAVYPFEDRNSLHRLKADESYQIGEVGHPVRAYCRSMRSSVSPGMPARMPYIPGMASCRRTRTWPRLARPRASPSSGPTLGCVGADRQQGACDRGARGGRAAGAGVFGALGIGRRVGGGSGGDGRSRCSSRQSPVAAGGVCAGSPSRPALREAVKAARREAESAFGDPTVFLEQAVINPRHIEVQILADNQGNVIHLFERDCSVQRRHQKVVELAPAPNLRGSARGSSPMRWPLPGRSAIAVQAPSSSCSTSRSTCIHRDESANSGGAHGDRGDHRCGSGGQAVAHRVRARRWMIWALARRSFRSAGAAMQCRITTEDPANGFRPTPGGSPATAAPGGAGIRLDGGTNTGCGDQRALRLDAGQIDLSRPRFRDRVRARPPSVGGVPDPRCDHEHPVPASGARGSGFRAGPGDDIVHRERPQLLTARVPRRPRHQDPELSGRCDSQQAARDRALDGVPAGQVARSRSDRASAGGLEAATRSNWGPRVSRRGCAINPPSASPTPRSAMRISRCWRPGCAPPVCCGGALHRAVDPAAAVGGVLGWGDLRCGAALLEGGPVGAVGRDAGGDPEHLSADAAARPQHRRLHPLSGARSHGRSSRGDSDRDRIFRIFDALNNVDSMRPAIDAVRESGTAVAEVAMSYTGDLVRPGREPVHTGLLPEAWPSRSSRPVRMCWRSRTWPVCSAQRQRRHWSRALRQQVRPAGARAYPRYCRWSAGKLFGGVGGRSERRRRGGGAVGRHNKPARSERDRCRGRKYQLRHRPVPAMRYAIWSRIGRRCERYTRRSNPGCRAPTGRVYHHEIPGGQLSNLRPQAIALGLGNRFEEIETAYAGADRMLGRLVKVTPSSKVVGDLALALVGAGVHADEFAADAARFDIPDSVIGFLRGELGNPPGGWPEPVRTQVLAGRRLAKPDRALVEEDETELAVTRHSSVKPR